MVISSNWTPVTSVRHLYICSGIWTSCHEVVLLPMYDLVLSANIMLFHLYCRYPSPQMPQASLVSHSLCLLTISITSTNPSPPCSCTLSIPNRLFQLSNQPSKHLRVYLVLICWYSVNLSCIIYLLTDIFCIWCHSNNAISNAVHFALRIRAVVGWMFGCCVDALVGTPPAYWFERCWSFWKDISLHTTTWDLDMYAQVAYDVEPCFFNGMVTASPCCGYDFHKHLKALNIPE